MHGPVCPDNDAHDNIYLCARRRGHLCVGVTIAKQHPPSFRCRAPGHPRRSTCHVGARRATRGVAHGRRLPAWRSHVHHTHACVHARLRARREQRCGAHPRDLHADVPHVWSSLATATARQGATDTAHSRLSATAGHCACAGRSSRSLASA